MLVHDDASVNRQPGSLGELDARRRADANHDRRTKPGQGCDVEVDLDTLRAMHFGQVRADDWAEHSDERLIEGLVQAHVTSKVSSCGGNLATNEPCPDHREIDAAVEHSTKRFSVWQLA